MNTYLGMRQFLRGLHGVKAGPPRALRSILRPHLHHMFWIHTSSICRKDEDVETRRPNVVSRYTEGLLQQAAGEHAARGHFDSTLPKFKYKESLSPRHFRLLEIYKRNEEIAHPHEAYTLEGTMYVASLDDKTIKYKALSYVWGDPAETESIYIDGAVKKITTSCASALRRALLTAPAVRIWVDAICINQGDDVAALKERGHQVAVMDEIYGAATEVFVYLGEGSAATRCMFRSLRKIYAALGDMGQASTSDEYRLKLHEYRKIVQDETPILEHLETTLREMLWFSRAWVLQEVAVSHVATILCGNDTFNFHDLAATLDFTAHIPRAELSMQMFFLSHFMRYHWGMSVAVKALAAGQTVDQQGQYSLQNMMLGALAGMYATRPEDRIFSLYGLCKRFGYNLPAPDYSSGLADLDFEIARCFLEQDGKLDFLTMTSGTTSVIIGLPSWVLSTGAMWLPSESGRKIPTMLVASGPGCSASGTSTVGFELRGKKLRVKGRAFDCITKLGDVCEMDVDLDAKMQTIPGIGLTECIESWWRVLDDARQLSYPCLHGSDASALCNVDGHAFDYAVAELLTMAKIVTREGHTAQHLETIMSHLLFLRNKTTSSNPAERKMLVLPDEADGQLHQAGSGFVLSSSMLSTLMEIGGFCCWKALGQSNKGYLGLFSHGSKVGDNIVVLHGATGPVVIRPVGGGLYRYIGAAYVQGIMSGEFWETGTEDDDTWFELI